MARIETIEPMRKISITILLSFAALICSNAADSEKHVVLVVWDGMRPDFVNQTNTPTLYGLANRGAFFAHHHPVYVSSTEVNGTALATGDYPENSGIIGNREFHSDIDPLGAFATESLAAMQQGGRAGRIPGRADARPNSPTAGLEHRHRRLQTGRAAPRSCRAAGRCHQPGGI